MGVWYTVAGLMDDGCKKYNVSCVVYAITVKEAINKATCYLCTDSDCSFCVIGVNRLDKDKVYIVS